MPTTPAVHEQNNEAEIEKTELNVDLENFAEEAEIINNLKELKGDNNWAEIRSENNFELVEKEYSFGTRKVYVSSDNKAIEELQSSRGPAGGDFSLEYLLKKLVFLENHVDTSDIMRIKEVNAVVENIIENFDDISKDAKEPDTLEALKIMKENAKNKFVELGFRNTSVLSHYKKAGYNEVIGYDINALSVSACKKLGWDARLGDLSCDDHFDIKHADLILAYHVLEHISDPLETLKMLNRISTPGTKFHIEIPIEPGIPRLRYGHLFPFERGDLAAMLYEAGWVPVSYSNIPHPGGPEIERIMAISK